VDRIVCVAIFKVRTDRQIGGRSYISCVRKHRFAIDRAIRLSDRKRKSRTRRCQRLESK
jgi:hypothetical protein